jgi:hypothetical protein
MSPTALPRHPSAVLLQETANNTVKDSKEKYEGTNHSKSPHRNVGDRRCCDGRHFRMRQRTGIRAPACAKRCRRNASARCSGTAACPGAASASSPGGRRRCGAWTGVRMGGRLLELVGGALDLGARALGAATLSRRCLGPRSLGSARALGRRTLALMRRRIEYIGGIAATSSLS